MLRVAALALLLAASTGAQEPAPPAAEPPKPVLKNDGKPMTVPLKCTEEDIRAFGLTCPPQHPCPVYLELAALEAAGEKLFVTGNLHTQAATLWSVMLASDDGGATWHEPHERLRAGGLDQIQFLDLENGWVSGQTLGPVPRDPFLLITNDGGKTWRLRPVYADGAVGVVEYFRFDSKTHGMLWIDRTLSGNSADRYEVHETNTGGDSWSMRQTGRKPLREKGARAAPSAGWRLRANAATKTYRIEKQVGERWQPVASFLVRAGECREAEVTLPEPPPPVEEPKPAEAKPAAPPKP